MRYRRAQAIKELDPDVVTLDIEMPNMNGLEFLEKIMRLRPMPVIMVSTLTHSGAEATISALGDRRLRLRRQARCRVIRARSVISLEKVKAAARSQRKLIITGNKVATPNAGQCEYLGRLSWRSQDHRHRGSSTGGVEALIAVLQKFPANCPPTVITQHMPHTFTKSFAERLNRLCAPTVEEATDGARLEIGRVYLAPGGERHLQVVQFNITVLPLAHRP